MEMRIEYGNPAMAFIVLCYKPPFYNTMAMFQKRKNTIISYAL